MIIKMRKKRFVYFLCWSFLARPFWRKSQAIVISRSSSFSLSCNYLANCSGINTKLWILFRHDKVQLQDQGHNMESYDFGVMSHVNLEILSKLLIKYNNLNSIKDINMKLGLTRYCLLYVNLYTCTILLWRHCNTMHILGCFNTDRPSFVYIGKSWTVLEFTIKHWE